MTDKPTLQQIANLPLSKTRAAIHAHYDPMFGMASADDEEGKNSYSVTVEYTILDEEIYNVRADDAKAAREKAEQIFHESHSNDFEISNVTASQLNTN